MDQNFSLMAQSRANYYTAGSPVQFVRVELLIVEVILAQDLTGGILTFEVDDQACQRLGADIFKG